MTQFDVNLKQLVTFAKLQMAMKICLQMSLDGSGFNQGLVADNSLP